VSGDSIGTVERRAFTSSDHTSPAGPASPATSRDHEASDAQVKPRVDSPDRQGGRRRMLFQARRPSCPPPQSRWAARGWAQPEPAPGVNAA
jgi:hypothetical protein